MMSSFLATHRDQLIRMCAAKVAQRPMRSASQLQLGSGIPLFLAQLQRTLEAEERHQPMESLRISGAPGGDALAVSEMGVSAMRHGKQLLDLGFSVDQVVHGYGDLCQAVTDLAFELDAPFAVSEFRTLNRCLDNGIASAVTAFNAQRDASLAAEKRARKGGPAILGYFQSQPNGRAEPSPDDAASATPNGRFWLIIANGEITAWVPQDDGIATTISFAPTGTV